MAVMLLKMVVEQGAQSDGDVHVGSVASITEITR